MSAMAVQPFKLREDIMLRMTEGMGAVAKAVLCRAGMVVLLAPWDNRVVWNDTVRSSRAVLFVSCCRCS